MSKELEKKSPLGGAMEVLPVKDGGKDTYTRRVYDAEGDLKKLGLVPVEKVKIKNPITGEEKTITIRRDGTNEARLLEMLASPKATREQKDSAISMYLFERGKDSASFLMDLHASKGAHTKESRHFQAQVRRDQDLMIEAMILFMRDASDRILNGLHFEIRVVKDPVTKKEKRIIHRLSKSVQAIEIAEVIETLGGLAFYFSQTAELMTVRTTEERTRREREQGRGIYVDVKGGVYSVYEDSSDIVTKMEEDLKSVRDTKKKVK